jgi:urate oxidase
MILKLLKTDNLRNNIINSLKNPSLFTEEFFEEYILENLVKIYKINSIKLYSRGDRTTQDIFINTSPQTRQSLGFVEENGIVLDNTIEDILIKKDLSVLTNPQISLFISFDKI